MSNDPTNSVKALKEETAALSDCQLYIAGRKKLMDNLHNFADVVIASEVSCPWHLQVSYYAVTDKCYSLLYTCPRCL